MKANKIFSKLFARNKRSDKCTYKDFIVLLPSCTKEHTEELLKRLSNAKKPSYLCGKEVPANLTSINYGQLDDLKSLVSEGSDAIASCLRIIMGLTDEQIYSLDVNDVFGFANFCKAELEKINKIFSSIKTSHTSEEKAAGVESLDFGSFGVLDWYARRMGIKNQNDVRNVAWVRIYQCMKNDNELHLYQRRLRHQYELKAKENARRRNR